MISLAVYFEFFYFVYTLLKPEDSKKYVQPYITYDAKMAAMRARVWTRLAGCQAGANATECRRSA